MVGNLKRNQRGAVSTGPEVYSILGKGLLLALSSPQMDFQCTSFLPNPDITMCCTIIVRTKELASSCVFFPNGASIFFREKTVGNYILSKVMKINVSKRMFSVIDWARLIKT